MIDRLVKRTILLLLISMMGRTFTLEAYDFRTHVAINVGAVNQSDLNKLLVNQLSLQNGIKDKIKNKDVEKRVIDWIESGGITEDFSTRSRHHFHYPLRSPWREGGLNNLPFTGTSSIIWGQDSSQGFSWTNARKAYHAALTLPSKTEREENFAEMFQALGQVMHLIADAAVPAHVRNDQHAIPPIEPYEEWVEGQAGPQSGETAEQAQQRFLNEFVPSARRPDDSFILKIPILGQNAADAPVPIARLWDTDHYDGTNPSVTLSTDPTTLAPRIGITEYANANFFSKDTVFADQLAASHRHFSPFPRSTDVEEWVDPSNKRKYWRKKGATQDEPHRLAQHLSVVSKRSFWGQSVGVNTPKRGRLDPKVHEDYARLLLPRAVGYSAALLDYFFRGTLDFTVSASSTSPNQNELTMTNTSSEAMDGTFTLYADNAAGERDLVFPFDLTLEPGATSGPLSFSFPIALEQTFVLVFEGQLGNEKGAVVGKIKKTKKARLVLVTTGPIANAEWIISGIAPITITMKYKSVDHMDIRTTALDILGGVNVASSSPDAAGRGRVMLTGTVPDFTDVTVSLKPPIPPQSAQTLVIMGVALNNGFLCISQISKGGLRAGLFPNKFSRGFKFAPCPE